ncbi:hypothetical protein OG785_35390 [Streptomyces sp. NBC_00006]|uniref:hypothetical protein n=1 Tax=unclassified Streptomyces TaxID=2593676 RepID=UPI0022553D82|nr:MULTISPECIES: hypothetical protein [unclassified Streptomyces]MCX5535830.1 hypothetical protein [Streptomyces sp. NBC_00006]
MPRLDRRIVLAVDVSSWLHSNAARSPEQLRSSAIGASPDDVGFAWSCYLRRFDLEHAFLSGRGRSECTDLRREMRQGTELRERGLARHVVAGPGTLTCAPT